MNDAAMQLNIPDESGWIYVPYSFIGQTIDGHKKPQSALIVESLIYSYTQSNATCRQSYTAMGMRLGICRETVWRSLKLLSVNIAQDKHSRVCASYTHAESSRELSGIVVPDYLLTAEFTFRPKQGGTSITRALKPMEAVIVGMIRGAQWNGSACFSTSVRKLAKKYNMSKSTIQEYISALLRGKLIYRTVEGRGHNGQYLSRYTVNEKLLRGLRKKTRKELRHRMTSESVLSAEERAIAAREIAARNAERAAREAAAERARWYAERRQTAQDRAEWYIRMAEQDQAYKAAQTAIRGLDIEIAKAEVFGSDSLDRLRRERQTQVRLRKERLTILHIRDEDLRPQYRCKKCNDTGFDLRTGKLCRCYSHHGEDGI